MKTKNIVRATAGTFLQDDLGVLFGYVNLDELFDAEGNLLVPEASTKSMCRAS